MAYGWRLAFFTLVTYLFEGALGLPVFAKGGGLLYLTGPTAGYLYGMTIAAGVIGAFAELGYNNSYFKSLISLLIGTFIIFLFGVGYLGSLIGYDKALAGGLYRGSAVIVGLLLFVFTTFQGIGASLLGASKRTAS